MLIRYYAVVACAVVERLFPPKTIHEVRCIATALNLLNAIVKLQEGKLLTSYHYIKGMVACLFTWQLYHPTEGVELDWDAAEDVTYVCVGGLQLSFHHVPLVRNYVLLRRGKGLTAQQWDGVQRQTIAVALFQQAVGEPLPVVDEDEANQLVSKMLRCNVHKIIEIINGLEGVPSIILNTLPPPSATPPVPPRRQRQRLMRRLSTFVERHLPSPNHPVGQYGAWKQASARWRDTAQDHLFRLSLALKWNGWWESEFQLARMGDSHIYNVVAYTGSNYSHLISNIVGRRPLRYIRPEWRMKKGWHYFLRRSNWAWVHMTYTRYLLLTGHYNYLKQDGRFYNRCITYRLARYLAVAYPQLRFINVLNYTRFKVRRRVYSACDLKRIGLHSKSRQLKVWMVIDPLLLLGDLDIEHLPQELIEEYRETDDYYTFFRKVSRHGRVGLLAYERFHLLPAVYRRINISGHFAHVMNDEGKWAVYSLLEEAFMTDFIFDAIYFDPYLYTIVGCRGHVRVIIHDMFNPQ